MMAKRLLGLMVALAAMGNLAQAQQMKIKHNRFYGAGFNAVNGGGHRGHHGSSSAVFALQPGFAGGMSGFGTMSMVPNSMGFNSFGLTSFDGGDFTANSAGIFDEIGRRLLNDISRGGAGTTLHPVIHAKLDRLETSIQSLDTKINDLTKKIADLDRKVDNRTSSGTQPPTGLEAKVDKILETLETHDKAIAALLKKL